MPAEPVRHWGNTPARVQLRCTGELKNQILDAAEAAGMSVNAWLAQAVRAALAEGLPEAPPGAEVPTTASVIADYLAGRSSIGPCGRPWPCGASEPEVLEGWQWCRDCGIRVG